MHDTAKAASLVGTTHVIERTYSITNGAAAMWTIHAEFPQATAVIRNSDVFAFGVMAECKKVSIGVPQDISVTGFDDQDYGALLDPPLTTVALPAREMGPQTAKALLSAMTLRRPIPSVLLETNLIVRASTSSPRG